MRTLKGRMTDLIATVLVLALLSGWFLVGNTVEERMVSQAKENLLSRIAILSGVIQDMGIEGLITNVSRWSRDDGTRVTLVAMNGKVLFDNEADPETMDNHAGRPEIREALLSGMGINTRYSRSIEADQIYVARLAADPSGEGIVVRLSISLAEVGSAVASARRRILASLAFAGFVSLLAGLYFIRQVSRPLEELTRSAMESINGTRLRFPGTGSVEVQRLAAALEGMSSRLDDALAALEREKAYLRSLLESLPAGVLVVDREKKIRYANAALGRLLRDLPEKMDGALYTGAIRKPELIDLIDRAFKGDDRRESFVVREKAEIFLEAQAVSIADGVLVVVHDMTERHRLEETRRTFIADAGHEFQTPLTSIRAAAELLLDDASPDPEKTRDMAGKIVLQQERMTALVDDLLLLSRLESDITPEPGEPLDLKEMIEDVVNYQKETPQAAYIAWEMELPDGAPFNGRPGEIGRALGNLVDNAVKYTRKRFGETPGGVIRVSMEEQDKGWKILVGDNGTGIDEKIRETVFERFKRGETSRYREGVSPGGYGLGLAIARRIIESHGGSIEAQDISEGASISVFFPFKG
ncbi:MAG: ATP-binding protein [Thermovirgaceae bacterium]|nr:ATP-binding protein [Synergistales bacterium]MDI9392676.1 ATP-binding protein [Synergistota bacterium]HOP52900.1 ATP-binding protein [Synergistales bacterium]HPJ48377.1 ATP-binding protein [Synergistales bacterium]HPQ78330.1 ATP-binding protein [Synergistales bacterium]